MEKTHTPLSTWFWAAYLVTTQTPGQSALQLQRQLGLKRFETAFQILHKLRAGMFRPDRDKIGGEYPVEVDETFLGGMCHQVSRGFYVRCTGGAALVSGILSQREPSSFKHECFVVLLRPNARALH